MTDNIYKPPSSALFDHSDLVEQERDEQIVVLASGFRTTLYGLYSLLASVILIVGNLYLAGAILAFAGGGLLVFGIVIIGIGERNSVLLGLIYLLFCMIPIIGIISLVIILKRAADKLNDNSYEIKIWGAHKKNQKGVE
jgi:membrane protein implicated in regulation of membrane protease activity